MQSNEENHVRGQVMSKQKEGMSIPQTRQNIDKCREQDKSTAPEYINKP